MGLAKRIECATFNLGAYSVTVMDCATCGEVFAVQAATVDIRRRDGKSLYCPHGHSNAFPIGETHQQRELRELKRRVERAEQEAASARRAREWAESQVKGANIKAGRAKATARRLEHRVNCGVCPHCQRTFKQLAAHIHSKHPEKQQR